MPEKLTFALPEFRDRSLLLCALTHRSYLNEHPEAGEHNERLEFLGDAVLNFLSGEFLYKRFPTQPEGVLTPLRSTLIDERQLSEFAIALNLQSPDLMRLSKGAEREGGRQNRNLLSSTFEAVIGAYFLDCDSQIERVRAYVEMLFNSVVDHLVASAPHVNPKSRLQEWALAKVGENPKYIVIDQSGPDHAKEFTSEVRVGGIKYGEGKGRRKQDAEKQAAAFALMQLKIL